MSLISLLRNPLENLNKRAFRSRPGTDRLKTQPLPALASPAGLASQDGPFASETAHAPGDIQMISQNSLVRAIPDRLFLFNRSGDCLDCQSNAWGLDGGEDSGFLGKNLCEIDIFQASSQLLLESIARTLDSHAVQIAEFKAHYPRESYFEARLSPFNENAVLLILRDVTKWNEAVQAACLAQAELQQHLEQRTGELERAEQQLTRLAADLQREIGARERAEQLQRHAAYHDALTGLPNRALFSERLEQVIERSNRNPDRLFAVLCLDLDRFQVINDSRGHGFGDRLLVQVAMRLESLLRAGDTVARLGEDEFAILLEEVKGEPIARMVAERVLKAFDKPFDLSGSETFISGSVGVVIGALRHACPADVLRDGELALYHAKQLGKARFELFDPALRQQAMARLELENRLRGALERKEFQLHYQAIQELRTGRITGFEALLRWNPPGLAPVSPAEFIPIAEETGLIVPIGEWVLREACRQMRVWQDLHPCKPPLAINVNISSRQFKHPNLVKKVARILEESRLEPDSLRLEITESTFMGNAELAARILTDLKKIGVQFQIDDFGTGYSSLSYLHQFPVHTIKIDRAFIGRIGKDGHNAEIVRTILRLARDLGMGAIAEGIETEDQLDQLKSLDCQLGQGFFIARPVEPEQAEALLSR
jgi:diguanylate cyclase (GGDEF)-like protein